MIESRFEKEGIMFDHSVCTTNGETHYYKPVNHRTFIHIMKIRVSNHSVGNGRMFSEEEHFSGDPKHIDKLIKVIKSYN